MPSMPFTVSFTAPSAVTVWLVACSAARLEAAASSATCVMTLFAFARFSLARSTSERSAAAVAFTDSGSWVSLACWVVDDPHEVPAIAKLGPDPLVGDPVENEERFVRAVRKTQTVIALLLMDQSVVSGIGNVYRAEMLFRQRLNPHTPGKHVPEDVVRALWRDWVRLLAIGVETGQMMTMDDLSPEAYRAAMASRDDRHWVYHRAGLPCRVCGTEIAIEEIGARKLYWCPRCQA